MVKDVTLLISKYSKFINYCINKVREIVKQRIFERYIKILKIFSCLIFRILSDEARFDSDIRFEKFKS